MLNDLKTSKPPLPFAGARAYFDMDAGADPHSSPPMPSEPIKPYLQGGHLKTEGYVSELCPT